MLYLIIIILIFLFLLSILCRYIPLYASNELEKQYIKYKIQYPHVYVIK